MSVEESLHQDTTRANKEGPPKPIGIYDLLKLGRPIVRERHRQNPPKGPVEEVTLDDSDAEKSQVLEDRHETPEKLIKKKKREQSKKNPVTLDEPEEGHKTPEKLIRKRKRGDEFEEEFPNDNSSLDESFTSPIIEVNGPPAFFCVTPKGNGTTIVIIKANKKTKVPSKRSISENDISLILNIKENESSSEKEEEEEDEVVETPQKEKKKEKKKIGQLSERKSPTIVAEESLRMVLRRSTDQSFYKIKKNEESTMKQTPKPVKHAEDKKAVDETPRRSSRLAQSYKDQHDEDEEDYEEIFSPSKVTAQKQSKTSILLDLPDTKTTPVSRRSQRKIKKSSRFDENDGNKANTDDSDLEIEKSTPKSRKQIPRDAKIQKSNVKKRVNFDEDNYCELSPKKTPKKDKRVVEPVTPKTPRTAGLKSETPSFRKGNLTPSMHKRSQNLKKPKTLWEEARAKLHVNAVPSSLPCREKEFNTIFQFLQGKLIDKTSGCMYISGVPGTGKTATVEEVVRCLKKLELKNQLDEFKYVMINSLKLTDPRQAFAQIYQQLTNEIVTPKQAFEYLAKKFTNSSANAPMTVLILDEFDALCNKQQDVVYNLLDWTTKEASKFVIITIANTMDLPERVLKARVTSRLGLTRLTFQPYDFLQLQKIVEARLKESQVFTSEAIQFVSRKVAALSGDARRALDTCRRATEIAEKRDASRDPADQSSKVFIEDVLNAIDETHPKIQAIQHCSEMEKTFLLSVAAEIERTGVPETTFQKVYRQFKELCTLDGVEPPNTTEALAVCSRLSPIRLLLCEHSREDIYQKILLNVAIEDIHIALKNVRI